MKTTKDIQMEVMEVHNLFWESYARRDIELRFSLCSEDVTFIGSGLHERALNKTEYKNINKEGVKQFPDPFQIEFLWTNLSMINEIVACVESEVVWSQMINNEISTELLRNTTLLKYDNSKWLVTHVHGSVPDYRLKEGDYMTNEQTIIRNKELERQVFERTQDLNETLEKLEEKNRELEIEASLERVRAVAMSMNNSDDLLSICEVSFKEFKKLGFNNLRNAIIHIPNDKEKYFMDYDFSELTGGAITKIEYGSHPIVDEYLEKIKSAKDAYFEVVINEDQLEGWKDFRKKSSQMDDPRLNQATSLYYYLFSIGLGDIGISSFKPIIESQLIILKRFRNVFELAYQRYTDIEKAEAQAREAQIEAALERVRSRTNGMQKSEELKEVIQLVYEQFVHLNIHVEHTGFILDYKTRDDMYIWLADKHEVPSQITISYFDSPHWNSFIEAKAKGRDFFANLLDFEEKNKFYKDLFKLFPVPDKAKEYYFSCPGLAISTVLLDNVSLYIENFSGIPYRNEENAVLMRFGKVFQQTYTRFLDLQKAEAQARQAQIETAMEKVRARALAMQKPAELVEVAQVLRKEMGLLGVEELETSSIYIHDEKSGNTECWYAIQDAREQGKKLVTDHMTIKLDETWVGREMSKFYNSDQKQTSILMQGENRKEWINYCAEHSEVLQGYYGDVIPERTYHLLKFSNGYMGAASPGDISTESWELLQRATSVFSLAYTRFSDLQQTEAQAREAQIEVALERVRSRTMAMHQSEELAETAAVVFKQLINLGIEPNRIYIAILKDDSGMVEFWITDEDGSKVSTGFKADLNKNISFQKMYKGWIEEKKSIIIDMQGEELQEYFKHLSSLNVPFKGGLSQKRRIQNVAYFSKGFIGIASPDETKPETIQLLERFAAVFNLTYTRFNDLMQAEAQNKIIQAENERKTKELEDARRLQLSMLPKRLPKLSNLDIAVHMETATEVGGDYYDFNIDNNGTLTIVLGDATGHGMMSGMMVSIMKSFFISHKSNIELKSFFENANNSIKDMQLGRLMMSFMGIQINSQILIATNAGMPSLIYFRNKSQKAGEFVSNNLPLGAMKGTKYLLKEINYEKGDTLLLMSDGFGELKNKNNEQYGYPRIIEEFRSVAHKNAEEIVKHLNNSATEWINGIEPDDDVTFVVIKVK